MMKPPKNATYVGDGVYAWHDGYQVWIATERVPGHWCAIALEPAVLAQVNQFAKAFEAQP